MIGSKCRFILAALAMSVSTSAIAYEINSNSYSMVREGLASGPMPQMADCSLAEDFGVIINQPMTYLARAEACSKDVQKMRSVKSGLPATCANVEGVAMFADVIADMTLRDFKLSSQSIIAENTNAVKASTATANDAVFVSSALCGFSLSSMKNDAEVAIPFFGVIQGDGLNAQLKVIKVGE